MLYYIWVIRKGGWGSAVTWDCHRGELRRWNAFAEKQQQEKFSVQTQQWAQDNWVFQFSDNKYEFWNKEIILAFLLLFLDVFSIVFAFPTAQEIKIMFAGKLCSTARSSEPFFKGCLMNKDIIGPFCCGYATEKAGLFCWKREKLLIKMFSFNVVTEKLWFDFWLKNRVWTSSDFHLN